MKRKSNFRVIVLYFFTLSCLNSAEHVSQETIKPLSQPSFFKHRRPLTLREKIGQLFMIGAFPSPTSEYHDVVRTLIEDYNVGGLIFMNGTAAEQVKISNFYQSIAPIPLLTAMDCEWGAGMRFSDVPVLPHAMTIGAIHDDEDAYLYGRLIGRQCKKLGISLALCPVVDINNNPLNPVINDRSLGENKEKVTRKGITIMEGIQDEGVAACAKHFCGHGDTDTPVDSHYELPVITKSLSELLSLELVPFKALINNGVKAVMIGHLAIPTLDNAPYSSAAISKALTTGVLTNLLGFNGLRVCDSLKMNAVRNYFSSGEAALKAIDAGCDVLIYNEAEQNHHEMYDDITSAIDAVEQAVLSGTLSESVIDERVEKIFALKQWAHLDATGGIINPDVQSLINSKLARSSTRLFFRSALTLVHNNNILPLNNRSSSVVLSIGKQGSSRIASQLSLPEIQYPEIELKEIPAIIKSLQPVDTIIVALYGMNKFAHQQWGVHNSTLTLLSQLKKAGKKIILVIFGNPYSLSLFGHEDAIIIAYENHPDAEIAAADAVQGTLNPQGTLPVSASDHFKEGLGLSY